MATLQKIVQLGWDTIQLVFAWLILWSFAFASLEEARIPLAVITGVQFVSAVTAVLVMRFVYRKNTSVCTSILHGTADPLISCFVVLMFALPKVPSTLAAGADSKGGEMDMQRILHYVLMILPSALRFMQHKGKMIWRSFIFICIYFLMNGIEIITFFMVAGDHRLYIDVVYPAIYVPVVFISLCCTYVVAFPLYYESTNTMDRDQYGRRYRHLIVLIGALLLDTVFLGQHVKMATMGGIKASVGDIFFYMFLLKDVLFILVVSVSLAIILMLKCTNCCCCTNKTREAIHAFYFGPQADKLSTKTHAQAIAEEEKFTKQIEDREKNREKYMLDERWQPQHEMEDLV